MKSACSPQASRELESITSGLAQIRILHRASAAPGTIEELQPLAHARLLARMTRIGLLRTNAAPGRSHPARQYSLTPKGRRLLATVTNHLRHLAEAPLTKNRSNRKQS